MKVDYSPVQWQAILQKAEAIRLACPGPVARHLNKRISIPISLRLLRLGIHPNWITFFNMILGISSGFFVAQATYGMMLLGGFIFQLASILDGCDGEVAKLSGKTSKVGQYLDTLSDNGALVSFLIGLLTVFGKTHTTGELAWASVLLTLGAVGILFHIIYFLKTETDSASLTTFYKEYLSKLPRDRFKPMMGVLDFGTVMLRKDCTTLFFFALTVFGILDWGVYLAIAATWVGIFILTFLKMVPQYEQKSTPI